VDREKKPVENPHWKCAPEVLNRRLWKEREFSTAPCGGKRLAATDFAAVFHIRRFYDYEY